MSVSEGWFLFSAIFLFLGLPVSFAITLAAVCSQWLFGTASLSLVPIMMLQGLNSFLLIAVPLFLFVGRVMEAGGTSQKIFDFAKSVFGWLQGGLGHVNVVGSMIFGGISGSSVADAGSLGRIEVLAMVDAGYPLNYSAALSVVTSTLAIIIPPSIPMVIYAVAASESVGRVLAAGLVPGIVFGLIMMVINHWKAVRHGWEGRRRFSFSNVVTNFKDSFWALLTPPVILGGIFTGVVTATEAAAVAAAYCIVVAAVAYKHLSLSALWVTFKESARDSGGILFIMAGASLSAYILSADRVPQRLAEWIVSHSPNASVTMAGLIIILLLAGMFMDPAPAIIILVPIFVPVARQIGYDTVHFAVIFVSTMAIGLVTPPVAPCLITTCMVTNSKIEEVFPECIIFLIGMLATVVLLVAFPSLSLWFPNLLFGRR
jgi:tripartite ATP-independent transporter DctM subunit